MNPQNVSNLCSPPSTLSHPLHIHLKRNICVCTLFLLTSLETERVI